MYALLNAFLAHDLPCRVMKSQNRDPFWFLYCSLCLNAVTVINHDSIGELKKKVA